MASAFVRIVLLQACAGLVCELLAWYLDWWRFPAWYWIALQVLVFWGLAMGALTLIVRERNPVLRFQAGLVLGGGAELLNHALIGLWVFPDGRVWGLNVPWPGLLALALAWGLVPLLTPLATGYLGRVPRRSQCSPPR